MTSNNKFPRGEEKFNKWIVAEYFKHGSVDEVLRIHRWGLPISYANYQRILDKWGVVKAAGPNSKLTEALEFMTHLAYDNIPIEELYKKMPPSFQTSASTLYRILAYVKEGITRRVGTALIITPYDSKDKILLAHDVSTPRIELGKPYGALSLPMGYSRKRDGRKVNIIRVLQQEVFTRKTLELAFPNETVPQDPQPFMYLDIADVRVSLYHLQLPKNLSGVRNFSSYKLKEFEYVSMDKILKGDYKNLRAGVIDAVAGYKKHLELFHRNLVVNPLQEKSLLNKELATIVVEVKD